MNVVTASWENRKSCENHERYRHCKRGGSVQDESQSLGYPEKAHRIEEAQVRRTAWTVSFHESASTDCGNDCCGKTAAASLWVLWLFYLPISFPSLYSAKLSASRGVLRPFSDTWFPYLQLHRKNDSAVISGESPERPSISVFGWYHQSEIQPNLLVLPRFVRKSVAALLYFQETAALFLLGRNYKMQGGVSVISNEKKAWAEEILRQKANELGRLPTKKDFDVATSSRIKAFLGTWPHALECAGLKEAKARRKPTDQQK